MGNRGLETRNSKRSSQRKTPLTSNNNASASFTQQTIVGALEVQNVKRAINRYGTLPKGARIGAYLDSLRQNGENGSPPLNSTLNQSQSSQSNGAPISIPIVENASNHSPRTALKFQPQMIRSNSSGGVTITNTTGSLTKLQRHRTTTDGTMMTTFSSFRSAGSNNSPKRKIQVPALADLEFPPPPNDLPPPPEEFEGLNIQFQLDIPSKSVQTNNDVSNTAPSVEEASTRFGVSLRKREPSSDSCSSLGSPANDLMEPSSNLQFVDVPKSLDPALLLMSETSETMVKSEMITKPIKPTPPIQTFPVASDGNEITFKAQLKKVEPKKLNKDSPKDDISSNIIDFKSRLRKVDDAIDEVYKNSNKNDNKLISEKPNNNNTMNNGKKADIKIDSVEDKKKDLSEMKPTEVITEDDKRKSTGSISSLKKLWEAKEQTPAGEQVAQLSPKMGIKKREDHNDNQNNNSTSPSNGIHELSMDPPVAKKPAVPAKPSKFTIYATPIQQSVPKVIENNNHSAIANAVSSHKTSASGSRDNILELVHMVECNIKTPVNMITATQWLQLSNKLNMIQSSCVAYADNESMPLHSKFQFRELVTRVENQSNCLRSAGHKNVQDNEKLLNEVGQSLKQLSNTLQR